MGVQEVPVLVVGGGPVGLSASLLLSRHGVRSLLVERHPGTSVHPKARGLNVRTLELFRLWGLEAAVRSAASELDRAVDVVWAPTLIAPETKRAPYGGARERLRDDSPCTSAGCTQDRLEPSLLEAARSYGLGEFRFGQELRALSQDADGVTARVVDRQSGEETIVRAAYLVAADGARSSIRSMLGIVLDETPAAPHRMGIYFRADLREIASRRPALLYFVSPPEGAGVIAAVNLADRWLYMAPFRPQQGERVEDFDEARCVQLVRSAVGIEDLQVELLAALPWSLAAAVADRFRAGRVFLAGDAAHLGSQGLNVGIQDVHNLAWKLAAVLAGWAGEELLASYEAERRPFALAMKDDHERNLAAGGSGERLEQFSNRGRVLGISYQSSAVIPDGTDLPKVANPVVDYAPTARPGSRAPHMWLWDNGKRISTLDLYDTRFTLLTSRHGTSWQSAAEQANTKLAVPLACHTICPDGPLIDSNDEWARLYGIQHDGAVLVRPDGHVACRVPTLGDHASSEKLTTALRRILSSAHRA